MECRSRIILGDTWQVTRKAVVASANPTVLRRVYVLIKATLKLNSFYQTHLLRDNESCHVMQAALLEWMACLPVVLWFDNFISGTNFWALILLLPLFINLHTSDYSFLAQPTFPFFARMTLIYSGKLLNALDLPFERGKFLHFLCSTPRKISGRFIKLKGNNSYILTERLRKFFRISISRDVLHFAHRLTLYVI